MSDLINKIAYLQETKNLMRSKLGLAAAVPFRDYVNQMKLDDGSGSKIWTEEYYLEILNSYSRPSDWLTMPTLVQGDERCVILNPVYNHDSNFAKISCEGSYTVDWGDGIVENFTSGAQASHTYTYSGISDSTLSSLGYKQVLINVSPQIAGTLTNIDFAGNYNNYLEILVAGSNINHFSCYNLVNLEIFSFIGTNSIVDIGGAFQGCASLKSIKSLDTSLCTSFFYTFDGCRSLKTIPQLNMSNVTTVNYMFSDCTSLKTIPQLNTSKCLYFGYMFGACLSLEAIPTFDTSFGIEFSNMFNTCQSLTSVPQFDTSNGTYFNDMFYSCGSLTKVPMIDTSNGTYFNGMFSSCSALTVIPSINTMKGINFSGMFQSCKALVAIPQLDTSNGTDFNNMFTSCYKLTMIPSLNTENGTNFRSMFDSCHALNNPPQLDTSKGINFSYMFYNCDALKVIPLLNTVNGTDFSNMFSYCSALQIIPLLNVSNCVNLTNMFNQCLRLCKSEISGAKYSISYYSCNLSRSAIIEIFNNLGTVTNQTINLMGNFGTSSLTAEDRLIATNKGWTITI